MGDNTSSDTGSNSNDTNTGSNTNTVAETLSNASNEQKANNQQVFEQARKDIPVQTMRDVQEITPPKPQLGKPDPWGAMNTKLDPATEEKIQAINKARSVYGTNPTPTNTRGLESSQQLSDKAIGTEGLKSSHSSHNVNPLQKDDEEINY